MLVLHIKVVFLLYIFSIFVYIFLFLLLHTGYDNEAYKNMFYRSLSSAMCSIVCLSMYILTVHTVLLKYTYSICASCDKTNKWNEIIKTVELGTSMWVVTQNTVWYVQKSWQQLQKGGLCVELQIIGNKWLQWQGPLYCYFYCSWTALIYEHQIQ